MASNPPVTGNAAGVENAALLQELKAKEASGNISPEETQILQQLKTGGGPPTQDILAQGQPTADLGAVAGGPPPPAPAAPAADKPLPGEDQVRPSTINGRTDVIAGTGVKANPDGMSEAGTAGGGKVTVGADGKFNMRGAIAKALTIAAPVAIGAIFGGKAGATQGLQLGAEALSGFMNERNRQATQAEAQALKVADQELRENTARRVAITAASDQAANGDLDAALLSIDNANLTNKGAVTLSLKKIAVNSENVRFLSSIESQLGSATTGSQLDSIVNTINNRMNLTDSEGKAVIGSQQKKDLEFMRSRATNLQDGVANTESDTEFSRFASLIQLANSPGQIDGYRIALQTNKRLSTDASGTLLRMLSGRSKRLEEEDKALGLERESKEVVLDSNKLIFAAQLVKENRIQEAMDLTGMSFGQTISQKERTASQKLKDQMFELKAKIAASDPTLLSEAPTKEALKVIEEGARKVIIEDIARTVVDFQVTDNINRIQEMSFGDPIIAEKEVQEEVAIAVTGNGTPEMKKRYIRALLKEAESIGVTLNAEAIILENFRPEVPTAVEAKKEQAKSDLVDPNFASKGLEGIALSGSRPSTSEPLDPRAASLAKSRASFVEAGKKLTPLTVPVNVDSLQSEIDRILESGRTNVGIPDLIGGQ